MSPDALSVYKVKSREYHKNVSRAYRQGLTRLNSRQEALPSAEFLKFFKGRSQMCVSQLQVRREQERRRARVWIWTGKKNLLGTGIDLSYSGFPILPDIALQFPEHLKWAFPRMPSPLEWRVKCPNCEEDPYTARRDRLCLTCLSTIFIEKERSLLSLGKYGLSKTNVPKHLQPREFTKQQYAGK